VPPPSFVPGPPPTSVATFQPVSVHAGHSTQPVYFQPHIVGQPAPPPLPPQAYQSPVVQPTSYQHHAGPQNSPYVQPQASSWPPVSVPDNPQHQMSAPVYRPAAPRQQPVPSNTRHQVPNSVYRPARLSGDDRGGASARHGVEGVRAASRRGTVREVTRVRQPVTENQNQRPLRGEERRDGRRDADATGDERRRPDNNSSHDVILYPRTHRTANETEHGSTTTRSVRVQATTRTRNRYTQTVGLPTETNNTVDAHAE
jgi:hypothetical protein